MDRDTLSTYRNFNKTFKTHTNTSAFQLGKFIIQKGELVALYSRKLTDEQQWYTTTERELIIILETPKYFITVLLGKKLRIYNDHKNLTCNNLMTAEY